MPPGGPTPIYVAAAAVAVGVAIGLIAGTLETSRLPTLAALTAALQSAIAFTVSSTWCWLAGAFSLLILGTYCFFRTTTYDALVRGLPNAIEVIQVALSASKHRLQILVLGRETANLFMSEGGARPLAQESTKA
jgi:hypothetical protein